MDLINVILDNRHNEDYDRLVIEFNQQGCHYKFWEATILTHSVIESISASFKKIVQWAKDCELPEVIIAEQDLHFTNDNSWQYFLANKPKEFDIYISGSYLIDNRYEYKDPSVKVDAYVGNHLIIISKKYYDKFLETNGKEHIDTAQTGRGDFYVCFPYIALQRAGWSANCQAVVNYNPIVPKEYIY